MVKAVNHHDSVLFNESFFGLVEAADLLNIDLTHSHITLDSGFDSETNKVTIRSNQLIPVIYPNVRNIKNPEKKERLFSDFESYRDIYGQRFKIERSFAWKDTYRRLVIRYERLQATHLGFKYLAFSMINLRWFIGKK